MPEAVFCYAHITKGDKQQLFHACTAKFADNSQCRLTVFDIGRHEMALCREHALKRVYPLRFTNTHIIPFINYLIIVSSDRTTTRAWSTN